MLGRGEIRPGCRQHMIKSTARRRCALKLDRKLTQQIPKLGSQGAFTLVTLFTYVRGWLQRPRRRVLDEDAEQLIDCSIHIGAIERWEPVGKSNQHDAVIELGKATKEADSIARSIILRQHDDKRRRDVASRD